MDKIGVAFEKKYGVAVKNHCAGSNTIKAIPRERLTFSNDEKLAKKFAGFVVIS